VRPAVTICLLQTLQFLLVTFNLRVTALGFYVPAIATDGLLLLNGVYVTRRVLREGATRLEIAGYVLGGMLGSAIGIWLTKAVFGQ